jgi:DNA-binding response OmpR family regulator
MRVLLIEDEATIAKSIELMLGTEGFNVYTHGPWRRGFGPRQAL